MLNFLVLREILSILNFSGYICEDNASVFHVNNNAWLWQKVTHQREVDMAPGKGLLPAVLLSCLRGGQLRRAPESFVGAGTTSSRFGEEPQRRRKNQKSGGAY